MAWSLLVSSLMNICEIRKDAVDSIIVLTRRIKVYYAFVSQNFQKLTEYVRDSITPPRTGRPETTTLALLNVVLGIKVENITLAKE